MKNIPFRHIVIIVLWLISSCVFTQKTYAQFTVIQDFKGGILPSNIILGGNPNSAYLTSGNGDAVNDGWLRLTNSATNQKGFAYINSTFPSSLGILIDFQYTSWRDYGSDVGADGIGVFFFDAASTFALGGWGGSLAYAPNSTAGTTTGLAGGYIGIGLDEYGNFSNPTEGRIGGPGFFCNSITLRGATTNNPTTTNPYLTSYQLQASNTSNVNSIDYNTVTTTRPTDAQFYRRVKISIIPVGTVMVPKFRITASWRLSPGGTDVPLFTYDTNIPPPALLKLGFAASTGGSYNYHEIRNLVVTTPGGFRVDKSVDKLNASVNDQLTYTINVYNATVGPAKKLLMSDLIKDGLGNTVDIGPSGDFTVNSITFNNNSNPNNTATGFPNGVSITNGLTNPFSTTLEMDGNTISTFTVVGTINKLPAGGGILKNSVTIDPSLTGITDDDATNNSFSVSTSVLNCDFVIKNTVNNSCADPANGNSFTLLVSNNGTINSTAGKTVTVTDNIPTGLNVTSVSAVGWSVSHVGNNYTFKRTTGLAFGASYPPIVINFKPPSSGTSWVNSADVDYSGIEATTTNNSSSVTLYASPTAPVVSTPVAYCQGNTPVALTATGTNLLWYNTLGGTSSTTAPVPSTAASGTTTYYVTQSNAYCESAPSPIVVTVNPLPTATISGTTSVCQNDPLAPGITFSGFGGTAPYTFTYNINGGADQTVTTTSGTSVTVSAPTGISGTFAYNLKSVKDGSSTACSNPQSGTSTVTVNPLPTATISGTTTVCQNAILAPNITFTGSGGTAPYTFTYKINSGTNQTITTTSGNFVNVPQVTTTSGTYIYTLVSVADASSTACSNPQSGTSTITINPLPTATISGTTSVCQNATLAPNITFSGFGGTAPYTFTYNINGGTDQVVTTTSGTSVTVSAPTGTSGTFAYNLKSVTDASSTACFNPQSGTATVTVNPLPTAAISGTTTVCQNDASPNITFSGFGGTAPYTFTYNINGGADQTITTTSGSNVTISQVTTASGTFAYNLKGVSDASGTGCSNPQSGTSTITVNPLPTATISGTTAVCQNATSPDITFTGTGGGAPYTFTYDINGGANQTVTTTSGNKVTVPQVTSTPGTFVYNLINVKDGSSAACFSSQSGTSTITVNPLPTATISGTTSVCQNDPLAPGITFTGFGGTAPYTFTYNINGGADQTVTTTSGTSITVSAPTGISGTFAYNLKSVKDGSSTACSNPQSGTSTVTVNPLPTATISGTTTVCQNAILAPNITFTGSGGTAPYTFTYKINSGTNQTITTTSGNFVNVPQVTTTSGTYIYTLVSVADASSTACSNPQSGTSTITINPLPTATISGTTSVCQNATLAPNITFSGFGGTAPYTFTYNINGGTDQVVTTTSGTSVTVSAPTGTSGTFAYNLKSVTDASSTACFNPQSGTATVTVNPLPTAAISGTTTVCQNDASPNITFSGFGGTAPYIFTYNINGGADQTITTTSGSNVTISQVTTASGTFAYNLKGVSDASGTGCSNPQSGTSTITVNPLPTATISGTTAVCQNATSPDITFTGTGGGAPYTFTYDINGGANQTVTTTSGNKVTVPQVTSTPGTFVYNLINVKDGSSAACFSSQSGTSTITVNPLPTATISGTTSVCQNDPLAPGITFTGFGGTAPYTFTYNINGGADQTVTTTSGTSITVSAPTGISGTFAYNLKSVKDGSSTACSNPQSGTSTVTVNPLPTATISGTTTVCQNAILAPNITFTGSGGTAPYTFTYKINSGTNQTITTTSGNFVNVPQVTTTSGTYIYTLVSVADASSTACSNPQSGTSTITINPLPTATISGTTSVCQNATLAPNITFSGFGGTAPYTFTYNINGGTDQVVTTTSGTSVTVSAPTGTSGTFAYNLKSVTDASSTACFNPQSGTATVTVNPLPTAAISGTTTVCQNDASPNITFSGFGGTAPYIFTYNINGGADQTITTTSGSNVTISQVTTASGTFAYNLKGVSDASSTACYNPQVGNAVVTINQPSASTTVASICQGYNYIFNGTAYNATGVYVKHLTNKIGCDSVATLNLTIKLPTVSTTNVAICQGDSYLFNGTSYSAGGTYIKHLTNKQGCDSTATLNLTIKLPTSSVTNASICQGTSYVFNGTSYTTAGIYNKHFVNAVGCDSTATLDLKIKLPTTSTTTASICLGDSYIFNGVAYTTSGTYSNHFINAVGCDSTAILKLTVNLPTTSTTNASICRGDSYMFCGVAYSTAGTYIGHVLNKFGCDSTATLNLSVKLPTSSITTASICQGDSYSFNGSAYTVAGTYLAHLINKQGCDSAATLNLSVRMPSSSVTNAEICQGGSYRFNGSTYTTAGTYKKVLVNSVGCDSVATLILKVNLPTSSTTNLIVSSTRLPLVWNKNTYYESGTHTSPTHFINAAGCDSTAVLILTVKMPTSSTIKASICDGDSYLFNGINYSTSGIYTAHLLDAVGVDSTAILNLTVNSVFTTHNNILLISGDSYSINGHSYNQTGDYTDVLKTTYGCDSTVVSHITVVNIPNTITPNGDGYNDLFMKGWHIKIYNRNGILLFDGTEGWNGLYHNKPVSKDTYFYVLYYTSEARTKAKEGYLMVIP